MNFKLEELTKDNEPQYLEQVANLEQAVMANMEARGQSGQLFPTGREDISAYAHSKENTVLLAVDEKGKVVAATYITQGQKPFTYNDITKYFKYGKDYNGYVRSRYKTSSDYLADMLIVYKMKILAFKYAKGKVLEEFPQYEGDISKFLKHEVDEEHNHFHEKSVLRDLMNTYMSEYIDMQEIKYPGIKERYEMFYWITSEEISKEFEAERKNRSESEAEKRNKNSDEEECSVSSEREKSTQGKNAVNVQPKDADARVMEGMIGQEKEEIEYRNILQKGPLVIHEKPQFAMNPYYTAKTSNSIELDTYITDPKDRRSGLARILLLEGITKHMEQFFEDESQQEIFLCSTLHRDNLSSKYVSEFFGLTDSLYVKRRDGRDREVHICRVKREEYKKYLDHIRKKVAVLYGYNPAKIQISNDEKIAVLQEQLQYEKREIERLKRARTAQVHNGKINFRKRKLDKIIALNRQIQALKKEKDVEGER